ncbi:MAG: hypothetical protein A2W33_07045 [Chloroflexi bacterium RBG_16_52_11]|nr:MAG: hypothetical protein A2W33_07045 [Chloroflexi bacterium RBG_16_52_11]
MGNNVHLWQTVTDPAERSARLGRVYDLLCRLKTTRLGVSEPDGGEIVEAMESARSPSVVPWILPQGKEGITTDEPKTTIDNRTLSDPKPTIEKGNYNMTITVERTHYEAIEAGVYQAKIADVEDVPDGQFGPQLKFTFLVDGFEPEVKLLAWASKKFSDKSKLLKWTEAALGRLPADAAFDSDLLIGKSVQLNVILKTTASGEVNRVDDVLPLPRPVNQQRRQATTTANQQPEQANLFNAQPQPQTTPPEPDGPAPWEAGDF